eukprot:365808-Chlamydomonas_euryale.AAC.27
MRQIAAACGTHHVWYCTIPVPHQTGTAPVRCCIAFVLTPPNPTHACTWQIAATSGTTQAARGDHARHVWMHACPRVPQGKLLAHECRCAGYTKQGAIARGNARRCAVLTCVIE